VENEWRSALVMVKLETVIGMTSSNLPAALDSASTTVDLGNRHFL